MIFFTFLVNPSAHWLLIIASLKSKHVFAVDSLVSDLRRFSNIFPSIFKIIWTCFAVARVATSVDEWKFSVCKDVPQQKNSYDCGIHAIVNAFAFINRLSFPSDIPSQKTRNWIRQILSTSNVEAARFEALETATRNLKYFF